MGNNFNISGYLKELLPDTNLYINVVESLEKVLGNSDIYVWIDYLPNIYIYKEVIGNSDSITSIGDMERFALNHMRELVNLITDFEIEMKIDSNFLVELGRFGFECVCDKILDILEEIAYEIESEQKEGSEYHEKSN